ncbi:MAG: hypothetical protein ACK41S_11125, partial [Planctomycetota bacterium]
SGAIRPIRRSFKRRVVGLERSFAKANRSSNRCRAQKVDAAPDPVLAKDRPLGPTLCGGALHATDMLARWAANRSSFLSA